MIERTVGFFPLALVALSPLALAQDDLAERVAELEERLEELEAEQYDEDELGFGMGARYSDITATFQIFGDVGFQYENPDVRGNSSFFLGSVAFLANAQFGDHVRMLSETVLDGDSAGGVEASQERLWGAYAFDDSLYAKLGVEHTPISRWNQLYHHGRWLETSVTRPFLAEFEGGEGILPMHRSGLELGGSAHSDCGRFEYFATLGNGRGINPDDKQPVVDENDGKSIDLGLAFEPTACPGFRVGGSFIFDEIPRDPASADPMRAKEIRELVGLAHVEAACGPFDLRAEFALIGHDARASGTNYNHYAGYVQAAHPGEKFTPFTRFDMRDMQHGDPFYAPMNRDLDAWRQIVGGRWDIHDNVSFTVEVGYGEDDQRPAAGPIEQKRVVSAAFQLAWYI